MRLLVALATVFLTHSAFAQPASAPSAPASSGKNFNARISALGPLVGLYSLSLDMAVNDQWAVGPNVNYWNFKLSSSSSSYSSDYQITAYGVGGRAHWFANGVFNSGLYVRPSVSWNKATVKATNTSGTTSEANASGLTAGGLLGYGWFSENINVMVGLGYSVGLGATKVNLKDSTGTEDQVSTKTSGLDAEFTVGVTF